MDGMWTGFLTLTRSLTLIWGAISCGNWAVCMTMKFNNFWMPIMTKKKQQHHALYLFLLGLYGTRFMVTPTNHRIFWNLRKDNKLLCSFASAHDIPKGLNDSQKSWRTQSIGKLSTLNLLQIALNPVPMHRRNMICWLERLRLDFVPVWQVQDGGNSSKGQVRDGNIQGL